MNTSGETTLVNETWTGKAFLHRAKEYVLAWPRELAALIKTPYEAVRALPAQGTWEKPLTLVAVAHIAATIVGSIAVFRYFGPGGMSIVLKTLISGLIFSVIALFASSGVFHFVAGLLGKEPGFYRTTLFFSIWFVLLPVAAVLHMMMPLAGTIVWLYTFYQLYVFSKVHSELSEKKARIFIGILAAFYLLGTLSPLAAWMAMRPTMVVPTF